MLSEIIEKAEESLVESICNEVGSVAISVGDLGTLIEAAKLLEEFHKMADEGEIDGLDLEWIVDADRIVLGDDKEVK